jgi:hypothetical protein
VFAIIKSHNLQRKKLVGRGGTRICDMGGPKYLKKKKKKKKPKAKLWGSKKLILRGSIV